MMSTLDWFGQRLTRHSLHSPDGWSSTLGCGWSATEMPALFRTYLLQGQGSGLLQKGGSYVTLTDGTDFTIVVEKMAWAHSQW